jgi:hypothetical protein
MTGTAYHFALAKIIPPPCGVARPKVIHHGSTETTEILFSVEFSLVSVPQAALSKAEGW